MVGVEVVEEVGLEASGRWTELYSLYIVTLVP